MKKYKVLSTPFPYVYGIPHIGNWTQIIKLDTFHKLIKAFSLANQEEEILCYYSYHLTGLPTYLRLQQINSIQKKEDFSNYLQKKSMTYLTPYVKGFEDLKTPQKYVESLNKYYTEGFKKLNIQSNLPQYHTTTELDSGYHRFVNHLYNKIFEKKAVMPGCHTVVACDSCLNVIGDHDRVGLEGIGVSKVLVRYCELQNSYYLTNQDVKQCKFHWTQPVWISQNLRNFLKKGTLKNAPLCVKTPLHQFTVDISKDLEKAVFKEIESKNSIEQNLNFLPEGIFCRCGGKGILKSYNTMFFNFENPQWKTRVNRKIEQSPNSPEIKKILIEGSNALLNMPFLRSKGLGSRIDLLKNTPYENEIVDSLMDSFLHPMYYSYFHKILINQEAKLQELLDQTQMILHVTGLDLLKNHVLFLCYFLTLLYPEKTTPYFETSRFIVAKDMQKMSKSLNNTLYLEDLTQVVDPQDFRAYVYSLTDDHSATPFSVENCLREGKAFAKHKKDLNEAVQRYVQSSKKTYKVQQVLIQILKVLNLDSQIYLNSKGLELSNEKVLLSNKKFLLRELYRLVYTELRKALKMEDYCESYFKEDLDLNSTLLKLVDSF